MAVAAGWLYEGDFSLILSVVLKVQRLERPEDMLHVVHKLVRTNIRFLQALNDNVSILRAALSHHGVANATVS